MDFQLSDEQALLRDTTRDLLARMLYSDGLAAIFVFGGIYGASVFGWRTFDLGLFGIILTLTGAVGAVIGGVLDDRIGAKRVRQPLFTGEDCAGGEVVTHTHAPRRRVVVRRRQRQRDMRLH